MWCVYRTTPCLSSVVFLCEHLTKVILYPLKHQCTMQQCSHNEGFFPHRSASWKLIWGQGTFINVYYGFCIHSTCSCSWVVLGCRVLDCWLIVLRLLHFRKVLKWYDEYVPSAKRLNQSHDGSENTAATVNILYWSTPEVTMSSSIYTFVVQAWLPMIHWLAYSNSHWLYYSYNITGIVAGIQRINPMIV